MAAGLILRNITTAEGVTIPTLMWADDTAAPTQITPIALVVDSSGVPGTPITTVAHDTADAGDPLKIGAKAVAGLSAQTLVAANDRSNAYSGLDGAIYVRGHCGLEDIVSGNASNTDGTSTQVIAAGAAGIKHYLTRVILTNTHASSNIYVEMKSGTTVKATIPVPAGGGATVAFDPPLPPNAAAEAWNFDPSAATTTIICTAVGFKSKV